MRKFKKVYIEITNVCNLSCEFCPKTTRDKCFMQLDEVELIIDKFENRGKKFYLHIMGEPSLHPRINDIISAFKNKKLNVNIVTNGTLLENISLDNPPNSLCVSLHSFSRNDISLSLEDYLNKAIKYYKGVKNKDTFTEFRLWNITKDNIDKEENQFLLNYLTQQLKTEIDINEYVRDYINADNSKSNKRRFNIKIKENLYLSMSKEFVWPTIQKSDDKERGFCYGLRNQIGVLANGQIVPCCLDSQGEIQLGNIFDLELDDILNSNRAKDMYDGFTSKRVVENLCKNCSYRKMYFSDK